MDKLNLSLTKQQAGQIRTARIILFVVGLLLMSFIVSILVDVVIKDWILKDLPYNKDVYKAIGSILITLGGYSVRKLLIDDLDELFRYLNIKDLKSSIGQPVNTEMSDPGKVNFRFGT